MQNQVFNGFGLIAAAIVIYGVIGLFGNRYVSFSVPGDKDFVWVSDRLSGEVYRCIAFRTGKVSCGQ
jgi:hypothetical protein